MLIDRKEHCIFGSKPKNLVLKERKLSGSCKESFSSNNSGFKRLDFITVHKLLFNYINLSKFVITNLLQWQLLKWKKATKFLEDIQWNGNLVRFDEKFISKHFTLRFDKINSKIQLIIGALMHRRDHNIIARSYI
jgi:hypothetical protein